MDVHEQKNESEWYSDGPKSKNGLRQFQSLFDLD